MIAPYYALSTYLRQRYGCRVQKIPLDAGFSCPNRDGTISDEGCIFCNPSGSGSGLARAGISLTDQWYFWKERFERKYKTGLFWAYLQAFTNTYAPLPRIREVLDEISGLEGLVGLSMGTRPDCCEPEKLDLIASFPSSEIWLELGMQTSLDRTLKLINRGHSFQTLINAVEEIASREIKICLHLILGLPGENEDDFINTINTVNTLPVQGIKFHNLYICRRTALADRWRRGEYIPLSRSDYISLLVMGLRKLRPDIIIQRLNGDPQPGELLAPQWAADKNSLINDIRAALTENSRWQGDLYRADPEPPEWFSPDYPYPAELN